MPQCSRCASSNGRLTSSETLCDACALEELMMSEPAVVGETFGRYRVLCEIGEGGLGRVYLAEQTEPFRREVALKVVKASTGSREVLARFETERQALALMNHPHIAGILDAGVSSAGCPFFAMEYIDGAAITAYCDQKRLSLAERIQLFLDVCDAVEHAHRKGILHRDLKPSNVLVAESNGKPVVKVIDFGIAKATAGRITGRTLQTEAGQIIGTLGYMSPEQADLAHERLDARTDVYSLGVMLYELLCGALPSDPVAIESAGLAAALEAVRREDAPSPGTRLRQLGSAATEIAARRACSIAHLQRQLSGELALILHTALAKDPRRRYASAAGLAADINRYLRNEPVSAHRPGILYRARKVIRRRRSLVAGMAVAMIVAAASLVTLSLRSTRQPPLVTPLTTYAGYELQPVLSPDGKRVAFSWEADQHNFDIYVKPLNDDEPVRLTTAAAHDLHPAWSPDGRQIAFLRVAPAKSEVLIVPATGGPERRVCETRAAGGMWLPEASTMSRTPGPAWSPTGKMLALANRTTDHEPDAIYLIALDTGRQRRISAPPASWMGDSLPAFSPSGREVAFVRASSQRGISDIYIVPVSGGSERRLTFDEKIINGVAWASENRIVFTSNRGNANRLWSIPARGGKPELIEVASRNLSSVSAGGPRRQLLVSESFWVPNIWRLDLAHPAASPSRLMASTRRNDSPKYSPDGKRIVFGSDRSGEYELWVADADGLHPRQITRFGGLPVGSPNWSPDGGRIVFDAVKNGRSVIYVVDAGGGSPHVFLEDTFDNMMPSWSRNGDYIYFASQRPTGLRIFKRAVDGGPAIQLTANSGGDAVEGAGGMLYYSNGRNGAWEISTNGGNERLVQGLEEVRRSRYFAVTSRGFYFVGDSSEPVVKFFDPMSHDLRTLLKIGKPILVGTPGLAVSPDDRWLLYCQVDQGGSNALMVEER